MYEFTELELCEAEFNNLLFMNPPTEWYREECPELPFEEEHEFLLISALNPLRRLSKRSRKGPDLRDQK